MSAPQPECAAEPADPGAGFGPARARTSFRFSTDGRYAACVAHVGEAWHTEAWQLPAGGSPQRLGVPFASGHRVQVHPRPDGSVWVCQPTGAAEHEIALAGAEGADPIAGISALGLRLVATFNGNRVVAVSTAATRSADSMRSTVWMVGETATPVLTVPGLLGGGVKLPNRIALSWARDRRLSTVIVDLIDGSLTCLWPNAAGRRLLLAGVAAPADDSTAPAALSSSSNGSDEIYVIAEGDRIGWCRPDHREPHWPAALADGRHLLPMAIAPDGRRIAFRVDAGARSDLLIYAIDTDDAKTVPLPGVLGATAAWTGDGLFAPLAEPGSVAVVTDVNHPRAVRNAGAAGTTVVEFPGPAGPVQAVCYGDLDTATDAVIALHGGPDAAWSIEPDPLLAALAQARTGCAVVAVNPRGSRGREQGRFGVDDLADIRAVTHALLDRGLPLGLLGGSYGAYLALRTLCAEPAAFARVALTAPFWSMSLYDQAGTRVRALLDRIAPLEAIQVSALRQLGARVLIVNGALDETVPPAHVDGLHTQFRQAGLEVRRIELPAAGHNLQGPEFRQAIESWFTGY